MSETQTIIDGLSADLPKEFISWRPQNLTQKKDKALALAYIDARDVQDTLDRVCGADGWQCEHYPVGGNRTGCKIGIKLDGEWVWKSDGAGESKVEAEKGLFSGSFKRAAVMWGVGRYLYSFENVYVPCETYKDNNDNIRFKKFSADPWDYCRRAKSVTAKGNVMKAKEAFTEFGKEIEAAGDVDQLDLYVDSDRTKKLIKRFYEVIPEWCEGEFGIDARITKRKKELENK